MNIAECVGKGITSFTMKNADGTYTSEAELLKAVNKWLAPQIRDGIQTLRICDRYSKGYSDLFICVRGQFVVIELKDDVGKPSPHQLLFIDAMRKAGAIGGICRTVEEVARYVEEAKHVHRR